MSSYKLETYRHDMAKARAQHMKRWRLIILGIALLGVLMLVEGLFFYEVTPWPRLASGIITFIVFHLAAVIYFIAYYVVRRNVYDTVLIPAVYQSVSALRLQANPTFIHKPKADRETIRQFGLFNRSAHITHRFSLQTKTEDGIDYTVYASRFLISTGQHSHVDYEGPYLIIENAIEPPEPVLYQMRSRGKPSVKVTRFKAEPTTKKLTLYVPKDTTPTDVMMRVLNETEDFLSQDPPHAFYLAIKGHDIHIAVQLRKRMFRPITLNAQTLQELFADIEGLENIVSGIAAILTASPEDA